ncbi:MAG: guanylate kinase [Crocinitomicaceae bacterium]|nr:guanylate kinase [Crocinitomicaceae bacterium]
MNEQGKCIIFSAPSGGGKTTIVHYLEGIFPELAFSISACSRAPRGEEKHGVDYYFYSADEFRDLVKKGSFIEWEEVYGGNFYGTLKAEVDRLWADGKVILFDVDVEGAVSLKQIFDDQALAVFIQPPSIEELERRLRNRKTDPDDQIKRRVAKAERELTKAKYFDFILLNDDLDRACAEISKVVSDFIKS